MLGATKSASSDTILLARSKRYMVFQYLPNAAIDPARSECRPQGSHWCHLARG